MARIKTEKLDNSELFELRKELHKYPELSNDEFNTAQRIQKFIEKHHSTRIITNIGGTGLAAIYEFSQTGPTIAIRCELDALPIQEVNDFGHKSTFNGVSHKCGHDGHMSIVAGLIFWLKEQKFKSGKVILLFQPAEETGEGAYKVLADERFLELNIDYMFALHNIPGEPLHSIISMNKGFSAEVQSLCIILKGKESHASEPESGINPALAMAQMITELAKLNTNNPLDENFAILTPVHSAMGQKSYGISPANGELHYTIRTWSTEKMAYLKIDIAQIFKDICDANILDYEIDWFEYFPASKNDQKCNNYIIEAANENGFELIEKLYPFKFGEDFGWFSKKYKTAMFGLGAGNETSALHNADYEFPDEIIDTGINMFATIISKLLSAPENGRL